MAITITDFKYEGWAAPSNELISKIIFNVKKYPNATDQRLAEHGIGRQTLPVSKRITISPTDNCQWFSMASSYTLFQQSVSALGPIYSDEDIKEIFKLTHKSVMKNMVLLDVRDVYMERIKNVLGGGIKLEAPYTSTRGTQMCIFLIDLRNL